MDAEVLVVGGGPAGLSVAACLRARGVDVLVLDRGESAGDSWRRRYDRLHLHTPRIQSALPGMRIPGRYGRWVAKDDMAEYVRAYADYHGIAPRFGTDVHRIDRNGGTWTARADEWSWRAQRIVVATGYSGVPTRPQWPGEEGYKGEIIHSVEYANPAPYRGRDILVVGAGNTGAEIAADLAEGGAARVSLSVRTPPNIIPRSLGPIPTSMIAATMEHAPAGLVDPLNGMLQRWIIGDLTPYGMPAATAGVVAQARATGLTPTIDVGLVDALRAGKVTPVGAVERFDGDAVVLSDGSRVTPDAVIAATGYGTGLASIVGHLGVLDEQGRPYVSGPKSPPGAAGLWFIGMSNPLKGHLFQIRLHAAAIARVITKERAGTQQE